MTNQFPSNWQSGFTAPHALATDEVPFLINGNWFLYVRNVEKQDQDVYSFKEDRFYSYEEFHNWLDSIRPTFAKA